MQLFVFVKGGPTLSLKSFAQEASPGRRSEFSSMLTPHVCVPVIFSRGEPRRHHIMTEGLSRQISPLLDMGGGWAAGQIMK
jgi:hypothetical protein